MNGTDRTLLYVNESGVRRGDSVCKEYTPKVQQGSLLRVWITEVSYKRTTFSYDNEIRFLAEWSEQCLQHYAQSFLCEALKW